MEELIELKRFSRSAHLYAMFSKDIFATSLETVNASDFSGFIYRYYRY